MKFLKPIIIAVLALCYFTSYAQELYIEGPREVCLGDCYPYYINTPNGSVQAKLLVTGPPGLPTVQCYTQSYINEVNNVCFNCPGKYEMIATWQGLSTDTFIVNVLEIFPLQIVLKDKKPCPSFDDLVPVCKGSTYTYGILNPNQNSPVQWTVTNAKDYEVNPDGTVTVTWGESGTGVINAFNTQSGVCSFEAIYKVRIMEDIKVDFTIPGNSICVGETFTLEPDKLDYTSYEWDFGDGNKSTDIKPNHTYEKPGTYTVTLFVTSGCDCTASIIKQITVKEKYKPTIDCKSTICENTEVTYTTNADCGNFNWKIIGDGKLVAGGGVNDKSITIKWGNGPQGLIELEVQSCNFDLCPEKAVYEIPIISEKAEISGEVVACKNSNEYYSIQKYSATSYQWSVQGGVILSGQGSHGIVIQWSGTGPGKINVVYDNCYLKCGGADELDVLLKDSYYTSVNKKEFCVGDKLTASSSSSASSIPIIINNWKIKDENGNTLLNENNKSNIEFIIPINVKKLFIISTSNDLCNSVQTKEVAVLPNSKAPNAIKGEIAICQTISYAYEVDKNLASANYLWTVKDGSNVYTLEGEKILVTWNSFGPYALELQQTDLSGNYCYSNKVVINPKKIATMDMNGNAESCLYDEYNLTATYYDGLNYIWSLVPSDAGTIVSKDKSSIKIIWNKVGSHKIKVENCAGTFTKDILVNALPSIVVNHPTTLCEGETTNVSTSASYTKYVWQNEAKNTVSSSSNPTLKAGTYIASVTDVKGCSNEESFTIKELPKPNIFLSTPDQEIVCLSVLPVLYPKLYALDAQDGYKYEWFNNAVTLGVNTSTYTPSSLGSFSVKVTDAFNCTNVSNAITVFDGCGSGGGGGTGGGPVSCESAIGTIDFNYTNSDCNTYNFISNSTDINAGSEEWKFDDFASGIFFATGATAKHDFSNAGYYKVSHIATVDDSNNPGQKCTKFITKTIEVDLASKFDFINACQGEVIQFYDRSTFIPGKDITTWSWDFDDPTSGIDNTSAVPDPTHVFAKDGTYAVKLIVSNGTCSDEYIMNITLHKKLNPLIIDSDARCEKETTAFSLSDIKDLLNASWNFGDVPSGSTNVEENIQAHHNFKTSGNYTIKANLKSIYNCSSEVMLPINIVKNTLSGTIKSSLGNLFCEGQSSVLSTTVTTATKWKWSTEETQNTITIKESNIYKVTLSDANGCSFTPNNISITINPKPNTSLVSKLSKGDVVLYDYDTSIDVCSDFDYEISAIKNVDWLYNWGNLGFNGINNFKASNLSIGNYNLPLTIKNTKTNCSNTIDPITFIVHGIPSNFAIIANTAGTLCEGTSHQLSVDNPSSTLKYTWSNSATGNSITTKVAGKYFAVAKDNNGCEGKSNEIEILSGPDINFIPSGCFERCNPDSMCFPNISNVVSYQWFKNGNAIAANEGGNIPYPIFKMSGSYHVNMLGTNGCFSTSEDLNLTLKDAFGTIKGAVYIDKNKNGVVDAADSLLAGAKVSITGFNTTSDANGKYRFNNVPAGAYTVVIDDSSLPQGGTFIINNIPAAIRTCDDSTVCNALIGLSNKAVSKQVSHIECLDTKVIIGTKTFIKDSVYRELSLNTSGVFDTIIHTIKFARKLEYTLIKEGSCDNKNIGKVKIETKGPNKFEYKVDNITLLNDNTANNLSTGIHTLLFTDDIGCKTNAQFEILKKEEVKYEIKSENISCAKGFADLSVNLLNYALNEVKINWSNGNTVNTIQVAKEGLYIVQMDNGCIIKEDQVNVKAETGKQILKNYIVCSGASLNLLDQKFSKDTLITNIEKAQGVCYDTTKYDLKFSQRFDFDLKVEGNCKDEANGKLFFNMKTPGNFIYTLSTYPIDFGSGVFGGLTPDKYKFVITDKIGCKQELDLEVKIKEAVDFDLISEDISCYKPNVDIGFDFINYKATDLKIKWSNGTSEATTKVNTIGKYTASIDNGCEVVSQDFDIKTTEKVPEFLLPNILMADNAFGNGIIDLNKTEFNQTTIKSFNIYDRGGARVYTQEGNDKVWDGTIGGRFANSGVYVYTVEAEADVCGEVKTIRKAGTITVVR